MLNRCSIDISKRLIEKGISVGVMSNTMEFPAPYDDIVKYIDTFETTIHGCTAGEHDSFTNKPGAYDLLMFEFWISHYRKLIDFGK